MDCDRRRGRRAVACDAVCSEYDFLKFRISNCYWRNLRVYATHRNVGVNQRFHLFRHAQQIERRIAIPKPRHFIDEAQQLRIAENIPRNFGPVLQDPGAQPLRPFEIALLKTAVSLPLQAR